MSEVVWMNQVFNPNSDRLGESPNRLKAYSLKCQSVIAGDYIQALKY